MGELLRERTLPSRRALPSLLLPTWTLKLQAPLKPRVTVSSPLQQTARRFPDDSFLLMRESYLD